MKYKFRAECAHDVRYFIADLAMTFKSFKMERIFGEDLPDVEFEFETDVSFNQIILILAVIQDSKVMIRTIAPIDEYTGMIK
jgi:hypothetical protein